MVQMTGVLIRRGERHTGGDSQASREAKIGVMQLQSQQCHGWLAPATRKGQEKILPRAFRENTDLLTP